MKKFKLFTSFCIIMSLSLFITGIYGYFKMMTPQVINRLSIKDKTTYTVIHETMNLDGTNYTEYFTEQYEVTLGTTVTPSTLDITGFYAPATQTVTLNTFQDTVIRYKYGRKKYELTINNPQFVTTSTPSGEYYYGTEIHLVADEEDGEGHSFTKWSDNSIDRDYTFQLTDDTTIGPIYSDMYQITYQPNNGDSTISRTITSGNPIGFLPHVEYDDCSGTTGDYISRGCTYVYQFEGWYTEPTLENEVNEQYVPDHNITLYAKWNKIYYYHDDAYQFTGNNFIDTQIQLFSETNADKDFIVSFVLDDFVGIASGDRAALFADMSEKGEPYPGVQFRYLSNNFNINANAKSGIYKKNQNVNFAVGDKFVMKRVDGIFSYSLDGGNTFVEYNDYSDFNLYFDVNATFGAEYNANGSPYRYTKGTLSEMYVELIELDSYTIKYHANGGTGMMLDQKVAVGKTVNLNENQYTRDHYTLDSWNTEPDGSGTRYTNKQQIQDLASKDGIVDLYAQWVKTMYYYVHFDANGGTGTMTDQRMIINEESNLDAVQFTKAGYEFYEWNTKADGTGTSYKDLEKVLNLTNVEDSTVTLYARYLKKEYELANTVTFDGVDDMIDTGINLYAQDTIDKDFEIRFTVVSVASDMSAQNQPTIINCKDESNLNVWPGFHVRFNKNSNTNMQIGYKWSGNSGGSTVASSVSTSKNPVEFVFKRRDGVVTVMYSYAGYQSNEITLFDQSSWTLNQYFPDNLTFGGIYNSSHNPDRFFKGTLENISVLIESDYE